MELTRWQQTVQVTADAYTTSNTLCTRCTTDHP